MQIKVTTREGVSLLADVTEDETIMEAIRNAGVDEILALCGGCCSCATCHVYVDCLDGAALPLMSDDENDLLDSCESRRPNSRLACQIFLQKGHALELTIAPEE